MGRTARNTRSPYAAANRKSAHHPSDGETIIYQRNGSVNANTQRVRQQQPAAILSPELEQVANTVTQRIVPELKDQIAKAIEDIQRTPTPRSTPDTDQDLSGRCADMGWLAYDQQFRLKRARNPSLNWGCVDMELWLLNISQGVTPTQEPHISQNECRIICSDIGVPLTKEKMLGPSCITTFLGLEIDILEMVIRIQQDELTEVKEKL
ncbi:unnamed protein product [Mytilus coruscus]|uniref:Uncharacterized protein n=1 Tax=Mytilus coruscus TaxID=42192 RepID=A0A6J8BFF5_MYTCO|nr:unnamed protein product [Mytilus coruscus]